MSGKRTYPILIADSTVRHARRWIRRLVVICACSLVLALNVRAQEMPVPIPVQVALFGKIMAFDRNLDSATPDGLVLAVLYQEKVRPSVNAKDELVETVESARKRGLRTFRCLPIDITDVGALESLLTDRGVDLIYVTPLRAVSIEKIAAVSKTLRVRSLTGVPEYVSAGLGVGIGIRGERPEIIINQPVSIAEGADFMARLLKLSRLVP